MESDRGESAANRNTCKSFDPGDLALNMEATVAHIFSVIGGQVQLSA